MSSDTTNLASLKCLLFLFFGGLGCLVPGLALAGYKVGLHTDELYIVSVVAPCVALFGPLAAGPLADRLGVPSQGSTARYGRYLRIMLVLVTLLGGLLYSALLYVPQVSRQHERNPPVTFICGPQGAQVVQDQCEEVACYNWPSDNRGTLFLSACRYVCGEGPITPGELFSTQTPLNSSVEEGVVTTAAEEENLTQEPEGGKSESTINMPRLCFDQNGKSVCHVYTEFTKQLAINISLAPSSKPQSASEWCSYNILDKVSCKEPPSLTTLPGENCSVVCDLDDPYNRSGSLLLESECRHTFGDPQLTFWAYLAIRSLADILPTTALALLASCLVVAAREAPHILCRQLVFATLGFALFPPLVEFVVDNLPSDPIPDKHIHSYGYHILTFAVLSVISALIILFDRSLPLSPVDYHLHLGPAHLTLRGAGGEIGALSLVLVLLGLLSTAIDSYIPWESVVLALIPSVLVLWNASKIVDYCGHSNILIVTFTLYIIRYTGLLISQEVWALFVFGALEVFTLVLAWSTAVLYLRHLVPRHFLVTGQALAIISFFCIGRCLGAVVGAVLIAHVKNQTLPKWNDYMSETLYMVGAMLAAFIACLYFVLYHFCLKHKWRKHSARAPQPVPQDTNANGTYTPLKIYNQPAKEQRIRY